MSVEQNCRELLHVAIRSGLVLPGERPVITLSSGDLVEMANKLDAILSAAKPSWQGFRNAVRAAVCNGFRSKGKAGAMKPIKELCPECRGVGGYCEDGRADMAGIVTRPCLTCKTGKCPNK